MIETYEKPKVIDEIEIDDNDLVRVDGIVVGRRVMRDGRYILEIKDRSKLRSNERGSQFVYVAFDVLMNAIQNGG